MPLAIIGTVVLIAGVAGGAFLLLRPEDPPTRPGPRALGIEFTLADLEDLDAAEGTYGDCSGTGGYSDFQPGMDVRVTDQDGKVIGTGSMRSYNDIRELYPEWAEELIGDEDLTEETVIFCTLAALVELDSSAKFYDVEVGSRGTQSYSHEDLEEQSWELDLSLGS